MVKTIDLGLGGILQPLGSNHPSFNNTPFTAASSRDDDCSNTETALHSSIDGILPEGLQSMHFCESADQAVDLTMLLARMHRPERMNFVSFIGAHHGLTAGACSLSSARGLRQIAQNITLPGTYTVPYPTCEDEIPLAIAYLERVFEYLSPPEQTNAIFFQPAMLGNRSIFSAKGYLKVLRKVCTEQGILLICDESRLGIGRTGRWHAFEHEDILPDMLILGRGLANGLGLGAIATTKSISTLYKGKLTSWQEPISPVVHKIATSTIEVMHRESLVQRALTLGEGMLKRLQQRFSKQLNISGRGLLIQITGGEYNLNFKSVVQRASVKGVNLCFNTIELNSLTLHPALTITDEEMERAITVLEQIIDYELLIDVQARKCNIHHSTDATGTWNIIRPSLRRTLT